MFNYAGKDYRNVSRRPFHDLDSVWTFRQSPDIPVFRAGTAPVCDMQKIFSVVPEIVFFVFSRVSLYHVIENHSQ